MMAPVPGFEGLYHVTEQGQVYSERVGRYLIPTRSGAGYQKVTLCYQGHKKQRHIHRMVAEAFIPNPNNLPHLNHKDGDKTNNAVENLEWCTPSENNLHSRRVLKQWQGPPKKAVVCIETGKTYESAGDAARDIGASRSAVNLVLIGRNKTAKNLHFKFLEE